MRRFLNRIPSREALLTQRWTRWLAPVLRQDSIWRLNRRSVARGVALGLFFGTIVPFGQSLAAAFFVVPLRANVAVAAASTFITNPFTTPLFYLGAYKTGSWLLDDRAAGFSIPSGETLRELIANSWAWLLSASTPTILGMAIIATSLATLGYVGVQLAWRVWVVGRWRTRARARAGRTAAAATAAG